MSERSGICILNREKLPPISCWFASEIRLWSEQLKCWLMKRVPRLCGKRRPAYTLKISKGEAQSNVGNRKGVLLPILGTVRKECTTSLTCSSDSGIYLLGTTK